MSSAEDRYQEAEELAQDVKQETRHRRERRARERARLQRLHAEEAEEDRRVSQYARAMRAVRRYQLRQEPAQVRRSLIRFNVVFVAIALLGAVIVWMVFASLVMDQGGPGWFGHGAGGLYTLVFGAVLACYARSCWARLQVPRLLVVAVWVLLLLPVPVMVAAAWAGWFDWVSLVLLLPSLLCGYSGIFTSGVLPEQSRKITAARET